MASNKNNLQFSNLNFTEDQNNDSQDKDNFEKYNPVSGITKAENFEFEFEPDEEIVIDQQLNKDKIFDQETNNYEAENYLLNLNYENEEEDELLLPQDISHKRDNDIVINSKSNENKQISNSEKEIFNISQEVETDKTSTVFNTTDNSDTINPVEMLQDKGNISNEKDTINSVDGDVLNLNYNQNNEDNFDNDIIEGYDDEDILAEVLAQDFTTPINGFEEYAIRKKIREEASRALDGSSYEDLELQYDDNLELNKTAKTDNIISEKEDEDQIINNIINEDEDIFLVENNNDELDNDAEMSLPFSIEYDDIDITDIPEISYIEDKNKIEELLTDETETSSDEEIYSDKIFDISDTDDDIISEMHELDNSIVMDDENIDIIEEFNLDTENIDNKEYDDIDPDEDDFFSQSYEEEKEDESYDDGGFQIGSIENDFNEIEEESEEDFFLSNDEEFNFDEEEDISEDFNNNSNNDLLSDYEKQELTNNTQEYLIKLRSIINNLPETKKQFVAKTKLFLQFLKNLKKEIKENGFKLTIKKYGSAAHKKTKNTIKKTHKKINKKISDRKYAKNKQQKSETPEWEDSNLNDTWGMGPSQDINNNSNEDIVEDKTQQTEADWDEEADFEEEFSFSTADMLMEDSELGLDEFSDSGLIGDIEDQEGEDKTDYTGVIGKLRKTKKISHKWIRLLYKYFDSKIDFEKNWWKLVDFIAVIVLTMSMAMVMSYYFWHK